MRQTLLFATALILTLNGNASSELVVLGNAIRLSWTYTTTNITFTLAANTTGWVGIGFSPNGGMQGADIVMIVPRNGNVTIQDRYATGTSLPAMDAQQDYKLLSGSVVNGTLLAKFYRPLDTCDSNDYVIKSSTTKVIAAYGALDGSGNPQYHGTSQRASASLYILSDEPAPPSDSGIFNIDPVPQNISVRNDSDTMYWCSVVQLPPLANKTHVIAITPMITAGNEDIVHHMLVYTCDAPVYPNVSSFACFDGSDPGNQRSCSSLIGTWAIGGTTILFPSNVGLPLDYGSSKKYILIQTHYSNMQRVSGRIDSSYLRFVATQTLRPLDAGILQTGVTIGMLIPPNVDQTLASGHCPSDCLSSSILPSSGINAFAVALHSHLLGRRITLRHFRGNTALPVIADDLSYDFDFQQPIYLDSPRVIFPGDALQTVCTMNSSARNVTTMGGQGTMQEMCLSFIFYYPRINLQLCQTAPLWMMNPGHPLYQALGRSISSFDWNAGTNDGLVGVSWSSALLQTLKNGYTVDANGYACQTGQTVSRNMYVPLSLASSSLPDPTAVSQQCQTSTTSAPANTATFVATPKSTGMTGLIGSRSTGIVLVLSIASSCGVFAL